MPSVALLYPSLDAIWFLVFFFFAPSALGFAFGSWRVIAMLIGIYVLTAVALITGNGWYGNGWGEFRVELNLIIAILSLFGAAAGVLIRKIVTGKYDRRP